MFTPYKTPEEALKAKRKIAEAMQMGQPGIGGAMASIGNGAMQGLAQGQANAFAPEMAGIHPGTVQATAENPMPFNQNSVNPAMAAQHAAMQQQGMQAAQQQHPGFTPPPALAAPQAAAGPKVIMPPTMPSMPGSSSYMTHDGGVRQSDRAFHNKINETNMKAFNDQMTAYKKQQMAMMQPQQSKGLFGV